MFYEMGSRYAQLTHNPSLLMLLLRSHIGEKIICRTFLDRSQMLSKVAQCRFDKDNADLLAKLSK